MKRILASLRIAALGACVATGALAAPPTTNQTPAPDNQPAVAFDASQRTLLDKVNTYFNSVTTLVGKFVQVGPDGNKTEGQFYMQKPGKIRFEYDPPSPIELISDGDTVAVRDRKLATQDIYPLSQTPLKFLLSDKLDLMKDANVVGIYQDELFITVVIEEKNVLAGTNRLMIMFGKKDIQLKQWTVTDPQGYDTTVAVSDLDTSKKPDPKLFKINYERVLQ
jgi:outer membrane lipoprotein-sorting protein